MTKKPPRPTMHDVAALAGVSQSTVSLIVYGRRGGDSRISDETCQRVKEAIEKLGYAPNQSARSLRLQRTNRVCLMVSQLGVPYNDLLAQALDIAADAHGYSVIIAVGGSLEREQRILDQLSSGLADGVLINNPRYITGEHIAPLVKLGLAVTVQSNHIIGSGFDVVQTTERDECRRAIQYLYDQGYHRLAFLGSVAEFRTHADRCETYLDTLAELGLPIDENIIFKDAASGRDRAYRSTQALLRQPEPPRAIFAASDIAALSAIAAARDAGLRVPGDVAVIGVGNLPEGEAAHPPLTTVGPVSPDFSDVTSLLFSRLVGQAPSTGRILVRPWHLILRSSA